MHLQYKLSMVVFKLKRHSNGSINQHKARLVAKGCNQIAREDCVECFASVAKAMIVPLVLALTSMNRWIISQPDINNAFLHGFLDKNVFMQPQDGYEKAKLGEVCHLRKSLYKLKQAS